jgi:hypothetical protein
MTQLGYRGGLAREALGDLGVVPQVAMDQLDGHLAPEPPVTCPKHGRHAPMADLPQ